MNKPTLDTPDLIRQMLPALDELIALLEYYDNATYRTAVTAIAESLAQAGLIAFDDTKLYYNSDRHDVHKATQKEDCDRAYVSHTHVRGYELNGLMLRKSIVDIIEPQE